MKKVLFLALIILSSCAAPLGKIASTKETSNKPNEYAYSDPDSKIRYHISNDDKNLHVRLNTAELSTITTILRKGMKICFDPKGKRNEGIYFQYPLSPTERIAEQGRPRPNGGPQNRNDLNVLISQIPEEAIFGSQDAKQRIFLKLGNSDIKVSITTTNNNELTYDLLIPLSKISEAGITSLANLSLGVVSGKEETSSFSSGGGGGRSGGRGGSRSGGGMPGGPDRSQAGTPVEFWFLVGLQ